MAKKTYIVTDPNGVQHTRKTDRTYTHAVLARDNCEGQLRSESSIWDIDRVNFDYYAKIVATGGEYGASKVYPNYSPEQVANTEIANAKRLADAQALVETHKHRDGYATARRDARVAAIAEKKAAGGYEKFGVVGFNGRLDLAQKAASAAQGTIYTDIRIVEATLKA